MDISTRFMGLSLPNPAVVSSSSLTADIQGVRKAAEAGAGAVVLKSLFEEDIAAAVSKNPAASGHIHPEAAAYMEQMSMMLQPDDYLGFVEEAAKEMDIPVIASLNCYTEDWWTDYAKRIENVGADAIELNLSPMALDIKTQAKDIEKKLIGMVKLARKNVKIPIAVKIGQHYSALPHLANQIQNAGGNALTLFNRFFKLDINIEEMSFKAGKSLSTREEFGPVLRWVGILSDLSDIDIAASTGLCDASDLIKVILAGGDVAQFCSVLYREGLGVIGSIIDELKAWMERHDFEKISDFHSRLSLEDDKRSGFYQRLQYVKAFRGEK